MVHLKRVSGIVAVLCISLASTPLLAKPEKPTTPKSTKASIPKASKTTPSTKTAKAPKAAAGKPAKTTASKAVKGTPTGPSTRTPSTTTAWTPTNPIAEKLSSKPNLMSKMKSRLPEGIDLNAATAGYKSFGQFVASVNASNNLGIEFAELKAAMTGTTLTGTSTGESPVSLGQAIQRLKPGVDGDVEATKALAAADADVASTPPAATKSKAKKSS